MFSRITFIAIGVFWVTMNILLWRMEYGSRGNDSAVPAALVWRKILTAPDASSLSIYQHGERSGFCEISTGVETEMAKLEDDKPPPEGFAKRAGYQIRMNGNTSLGDFTNRVRFDGRISFVSSRQWRELNLRLSSHNASVEIHSVDTNRTLEIKISNDAGTIERSISFANLENPNALMREITGSFGGGLFTLLDIPELPQDTAVFSRSIIWEAHRDRLKVGNEPVSVYRVDTRVLEYPIVVYASTLGEILRVELPGGLVATPDEWTK